VSHRLDNDPLLNIFAVIAGHQRRRLLAELAAGLSYIRGFPASSAWDLTARAGLAPWQHDTRRWDQYRSPVGWLVQAELLAGYRYLRLPNARRGGNRLTTLAAIDAAYFAGGDSLGLSVRFAAGLTWSPWEEAQGPDADYRVLKDVSLAFGVLF
jgi:hypothetical protein